MSFYKKYQKIFLKDGGHFQNGDRQFPSCSLSVNFQPILMFKCFLKTSRNYILTEMIKNYFFKLAEIIKMAVAVSKKHLNIEIG
jgi:hypothetical protein